VLAVTGLDSGDAEEPSRWVEIAPLLFQREDSEERIAFRADASGRITHLFARCHTPGAFDRAAWYQQPAFHQLLLGACLLIFVTVAIGWPLAALVRRLAGRSRFFPPAVRWARRWAFGVSALNLLFTVMVVTLTSAQPLQFGVPVGVRVLFVLPLLTTAMVLLLPILGVRAWNATWSIVARGHYLLVTLASFAFVWFLNFWNLLGFRF
jgi:hypothetical protein